MNRAALSHPRRHALCARFTWTAALLAVGVGDSPASDANRVRIRSQSGYRGCAEAPIRRVQPLSCEDQLTNRVVESPVSAVLARPGTVV